MTLEQRVKKLEELYANLSESFIQAQKNQVVNTAKTDDNTNNIKTITPYTETKTAYYGETEKVFYDVPKGNIAIFTNPAIATTWNRMGNTVIVRFLTNQQQKVDITISIS